MQFSLKRSAPDAADDQLVTHSTPDPIPKASGRQRLLAALFIIFCMLGAVLMSRFFLINNSLRLDEAQSLWQTSHTLPGTLKVVAEDVHVPLYHVILHFWQIFVGPGAETARALSLIFFLATIPIVYLLARRLLPVKWSLFVVGLFSFSPFMNWYANEVRMYTLLVLMATLSQYFFLKLIESRGRSGWLGYALTALVGVYSHYFFLFNLTSQGIYFLFTRRQFVSGTLKRFIALAALLAVWLAPWFYYFYSLGSGSNTSPNLARPSSVDLFNVFSQFSFGFQNNQVNTVLLSMWPIIVIVTLLSVKYGQRISTKMGYVIVAGILPIVLAFVLSYLVSPFFVGRYMAACVAPLAILLAWLISNYRQGLYRAVSLGIVGLLIGVSAQQYSSGSTPVKEDYRLAASVISDQAKAHDVVVLTAPFTVYPFNYYYDGTARVYTLPDWQREVPGPIPAFNPDTLPGQVEALNKNHQYVYLLLSYDQGYEEEIYQHYQQRFEKVDSRRLSPDLRLEVYRVGYNPLKALSEVGQ